LVDFYATWCGPCKAIAPYVHTQCQSNGVALAKVDVDVAGDVSAKYGITAMPTFKVLDAAGKVLGEVVGGGQPNVNKVIGIAKSNKKWFRYKNHLIILYSYYYKPFWSVKDCHRETIVAKEEYLSNILRDGKLNHLFSTLVFAVNQAGGLDKIALLGRYMLWQIK